MLTTDKTIKAIYSLCKENRLHELDLKEQTSLNEGGYVYIYNSANEHYLFVKDGHVLRYYTNVKPSVRPMLGKDNREEYVTYTVSGEYRLEKDFISIVAREQSIKSSLEKRHICSLEDAFDLIVEISKNRYEID